MTHLNSNRPLVGIWILIKHPQKGMIKVIRKNWVIDGSYDLVYFTETDEEIRGNFLWCYP